MNNKLLLITCITLLYRQSQLEKSEKSADLVRSILEQIQMPVMAYGLDHERDILDGLKTTALAMCNDPADHRYEVMEVMQELRMNAGDDNTTYEALRDGIEIELEEKALHRTVNNLERKLRDHFSYENANKVIQDAAYAMKFDKTKIKDFHKFIQKLNGDLEPYCVQSSAVKDPAIISEVDVDDEAAMAAVYEQIQDAENGASILKTPWKGINRMLQGGVRRGEMGCVSALQHNYKTGFTLNLLKGFALYNTPFMLDPNKKPLLLRISFEDTIENNFEFLYKSLVENESGQEANTVGMDPKEIAQIVKRKLRVNGYHVKMIRVDPTQWAYRDILNKIIELEMLGYEIHACIIDYLAMIPTTGCIQGPAGSDVRDLFRRMRNFCNPRKIALVTPHQISTDAKRQMRLGSTDFVKQLPGKGYYAGCASLDNELDWEIHMHIEKLNGRSYLTLIRGKHRLNTMLPLDDFYCVLPFEPIAGIRDDTASDTEITLRRVGGGAIGSGEEIPMWDMA